MDIRRAAKKVAAQFGTYVSRVSVAEQYIRGAGIEIGALQDPQAVPKGVTVRYVDIASTEELRAMYPRKKDRHLVEVDIVDDGERLGTVDDTTQDFVIANHFFEHCEDPIGTLGNMLRVLRPGGIVLMTLPDKRFMFDRRRPPTTWEHLVRDHEEGPEWSRAGHYEEVVRYASKERGEENIQRRIRELQEENYRIHFHSWSQAEFLEFLTRVQSRPGFDFDVELFQKNRMEMLFVLRRHDPEDAELSTPAEEAVAVQG
jgi:predicted SAM-dependent methyltransferase